MFLQTFTSLPSDLLKRESVIGERSAEKIAKTSGFLRN